MQEIHFEEAPGHWIASPEKSRSSAIAWAKRNRARLVSAKADTVRELARDFFDPSGPWTERMVAKGHTFVTKYLRTRQGHLDNYLIPLFGKRDPRTITRREIDDAILGAKRLDGGPLAGETKNKVLYSINLFFEELIDRGKIERNPMEGIRPYDKTPVKPRGVIPRDALAKLFPDTHGALVQVWGSSMWASVMLVLMDTGMRPGEARALRWEELHQEIDFASGAASWAFVVRHGIEAGTAAKVKTTKNDMVKAGGLSARTVQELAIWREESKHGADGDFIFTQKGAAPVTNEGISAAFRRGLESVGIESKEWTPYWLRHSFVTNALRVLPPESIAALAGHSVEVSRVYQHPDDEIVLAKSRADRETLDKARG